MLDKIRGLHSRPNDIKFFEFMAVLSDPEAPQDFTQEEWIGFCQELPIKLTGVEQKVLFETNQDEGILQMEKFRNSLLIPMNESRREVVDSTFAKIVGDSDCVPLDFVASLFRSQSSVYVTSGKMTEDQMRERFRKTFCPPLVGCDDGNITIADWLYYHTILSTTIPEDNFFTMEMWGIWNISSLGKMKTSSSRHQKEVHIRSTEAIARSFSPTIPSGDAYCFAPYDTQPIDKSFYKTTSSPDTPHRKIQGFDEKHSIPQSAYPPESLEKEDYPIASPSRRSVKQQRAREIAEISELKREEGVEEEKFPPDLEASSVEIIQQKMMSALSRMPFVEVMKQIAVFTSAASPRPSTTRTSTILPGGVLTQETLKTAFAHSAFRLSEDEIDLLFSSLSASDLSSTRSELSHSRRDAGFVKVAELVKFVMPSWADVTDKDERSPLLPSSPSHFASRRTAPIHSSPSPLSSSYASDTAFSSATPQSSPISTPHKQLPSDSALTRSARRREGESKVLNEEHHLSSRFSAVLSAWVSAVARHMMLCHTDDYSQLHSHSTLEEERRFVSMRIPLSAVRDAFCALTHPDAKSGRRTESECLEEFLSTFCVESVFSLDDRLFPAGKLLPTCNCCTIRADSYHQQSQLSIGFPEFSNFFSLFSLTIPRDSTFSSILEGCFRTNDYVSSRRADVEKLIDETVMGDEWMREITLGEKIPLQFYFESAEERQKHLNEIQTHAKGESEKDEAKKEYVQQALFSKQQEFDIFGRKSNTSRWAH